MYFVVLLVYFIRQVFLAPNAVFGSQYFDAQGCTIMVVKCDIFETVFDFSNVLRRIGACLDTITRITFDFANIFGHVLHIFANVTADFDELRHIGIFLKHHTFETVHPPGKVLSYRFNTVISCSA